GFIDHRSSGLYSEGYDAWVTVAPDFLFRSDWHPLSQLEPGRGPFYRGSRRLVKSISDTLHHRLYGHRLAVYSYRDAIELALKVIPKQYPRQPCVFPNWDNTPRSGIYGVVYLGSTPKLFGEYIREAVKLVSDYPSEEQIVWIKSWNEWAEGNYLEPDRDYG